MNAATPRTAELLALMHAWTGPLIDHPAFRQLARSKIASTLDWEDDWPTKEARVTAVILPRPLSEQHDAVIQFYNLWQAVDRLKTSEYYFRRYPFTGLPIERHDHLENMCTLFFSHFYVIQERLKVFLNALNRASAPSQIEVGSTVARYKRRFKAELQERNGATHLRPFDDLTLHAVMLRSLRFGSGDQRQQAGAAYTYRKAAREWAGHARRGAQSASEFLELVAEATLQIADFLRTPPTNGLDELKVR